MRASISAAVSVRGSRPESFPPVTARSAGGPLTFLTKASSFACSWFKSPKASRAACTESVPLWTAVTYRSMAFVPANCGSLIK